MDRLIEETLYSLPQVFIDSELDAVKSEVAGLGEISSRFRAACKVRLTFRSPSDKLMPSPLSGWS
jgi:hypothetical protein